MVIFLPSLSLLNLTGTVGSSGSKSKSANVALYGPLPDLRRPSPWMSFLELLEIDKFLLMFSFSYPYDR